MLTPLLQWLLHPVVWFVNLFVQALLLIVGIRPEESTQMEKLSMEELRTLVLEGGKLHPEEAPVDLPQPVRARGHDGATTP